MALNAPTMLVEDGDWVEEGTQLTPGSMYPADVLRYRYGMDDFPVMTLEEIGRVFNLTRERVRQIEAKALKRLREMIPSENVL